MTNKSVKTFSYTEVHSDFHGRNLKYFQRLSHNKIPPKFLKLSHSQTIFWTFFTIQAAFFFLFEPREVLPDRPPPRHFSDLSLQTLLVRQALLLFLSELESKKKGNLMLSAIKMHACISRERSDNHNLLICIVNG